MLKPIYRVKHHMICVIRTIAVLAGIVFAVSVASSTQSTGIPDPANQTQPIPANDNRKINVILVGYDIENNLTAQQQLEEIAKAVQAGGGQGHVLLAGHDRAQLQQAMSQAINIATGTSVPTSGGGGYVMATAGTNWGLILAVSLILMSSLLVVAILVVRNRRSPEPCVRTYGYLDVTYKDGGTKSFPIQGRTKIGRSEGAELVLRDDEVSGTHAELIPSDTGYILRDLGSTNGTFVNDRQIAEQSLKSGDRIHVGDTILIFRA